MQYTEFGLLFKGGFGTEGKPMKQLSLIESSEAIDRGVGLSHTWIRRKTAAFLYKWRIESELSSASMAKIFGLSVEMYLACEGGWRSMPSCKLIEGVGKLGFEVQREIFEFLREIHEAHIGVNRDCS